MLCSPYFQEVICQLQDGGTCNERDDSWKNLVAGCVGANWEGLAEGAARAALKLRITCSSRDRKVKRGICKSI